MASISKRESAVWQNTSYGIRATATDTITTLPTTIYSDGTNATVGISGNTLQNGTPTHDNPIMPRGCGELETSGEHSGQYKIPILSAGQTNSIYLGEVQSTRQIKKYEFTGNEAFAKNGGIATQCLYYTHLESLLSGSIAKTPVMCNELPVTNNAPESQIGINTNNIYGVVYLNFGADVMNAQPSGNTATGLKEYLAQQYAAGTPVTVWYVLATETTGIVNEPLMKIGEYADTVSDITIPTITSKDTFDVDTTLKPSEVSLSYTGWHDAKVKEKSENLFDKNATNVNNGYITNGFLQSDGSITTSNDYRTSEYIRIVQNQSYTLFYGSNLNLPSVCFYDSAKNYISGIAYANRWDVPFTTPQNAEYLRLSFRAVDPSSIMLNSGSTPLPYEPYWK